MGDKEMQNVSGARKECDIDKKKEEKTRQQKKEVKRSGVRGENDNVTEKREVQKNRGKAMCVHAHSYSYENYFEFLIMSQRIFWKSEDIQSVHFVCFKRHGE